MKKYKKKILEYLVNGVKNIKNLDVDSLSSLLSSLLSVKNVKNVAKKPGGNFIINVFIVLLIILQSFFPETATYMTIAIIVLFVLGIVIVVVTMILSGGISAVFMGSAVTDFLLPLTFLVIFSVIIKLIGSPNYYEFIHKHYGALAASGTFFLTMIIGFLIATIRNGIKFLATNSVFAIVLILIIPMIISQASSNPWGLCTKLPFSENYCNPRETIVSKVNYVHIPVSGGIGVEIDTSNTLYAGELYEFKYRITNNYVKPIEFHVTPALENTLFHVEVQPNGYKQVRTNLKPREYYDDAVVIQPDDVSIVAQNGKQKGNCYYTTEQISIEHHIDPSEVECAIDKPCSDPNKACVKTDNFTCSCVDWANITCSGGYIKAKLHIKHTGYFKGKADLYVYNYSKTHIIPPAAKGVEYTQGPLSVKIYIYPNPYIIGIHDYRKSIPMFVKFRNRGPGDITITNFKVTPLTTNITTIDKEKRLKLEESIGWKIISCKDIDGTFIPRGEEKSFVICYLTPPFVNSKLTIYNPQNNTEKIILNNASLDRLYEYCRKKSYNSSSLPTMRAILNGINPNELEWSNDWSNIYKYVDESGLCEILNSKDKENKHKKEVIESSLNHTTVVVEFDYVRDVAYYSRSIKPYTATDKCMSFA